jgi:hypothetical protein
MAEQLMDNKVQLGCGTLIIIAIIVIVFSGGDDSKRLRSQLDDVERKIDGLEKKIDELFSQDRQAPVGSARRATGSVTGEVLDSFTSVRKGQRWTLATSRSAWP